MVKTTTDNNETQQPTAEALLIGSDRAAAMLGVSRSFLYSMHSSGKLGPLPRRLSARCTRWNPQELAEWVNAGCPPREQWQAMKAAVG
jgi:predicted DNA-binding transcriptional regulator AlpA